MLLWKAFQEEWELQKGDKLSIKVNVFEYKDIIVPVGVMVWCPTTFVHSDVM